MTAEPRFYKNTRTWEYRCPEPGCKFAVVTPRESEARSNLALHNERKHP